jgi:hypothetical protein
MLLEWRDRSIPPVGLRGVTRFATDIDMKADPKCLTGIEL